MAVTQMDLIRALPRFKDLGLKVKQGLAGGRWLVITRPDGGRESWTAISVWHLGAMPEGAVRYGGNAYLKRQDLPPLEEVSK